MKTLEIKIKGIRPILMHNGAIADPLSPQAKSLKRLSSKRNKTDDDHAAMAEVEWEAGLYWDDDLGAYIPAENIFTMFQEACKKRKLGRQSIALLVDEEIGARLQTPKGKDKGAMRADPTYRLSKVVSVGTAKVVRTRPRIPTGWGLTIRAIVDENIMDVEQVADVFEIAGNIIGLGDWRPSSRKPGNYGRFEVESVEVVA